MSNVQEAVLMQEAVVRALAREVSCLDAHSADAAELRVQLVEESGRLALLLASTEATERNSRV